MRYSALTAVITTIEWSLLLLKGRANFDVPIKPRGKNEAVHMLQVFALRCGQDVAEHIKEFELLTKVRNCVVHSAGRIETYEFRDELRRSLDGHYGLKLSNVSFMGEGIEIGAGYLQGFIAQAKRWLPALEKTMHQQGLLR